MDLEEIKGRLEKLAAMFLGWPVEVHAWGQTIPLFRVHDELSEIRRLLDEPDGEGGMGLGLIAGMAARISAEMDGWMKRNYGPGMAPFGTGQLVKDLATMAGHLERLASGGKHPDLVLEGDGFVVLPIARFDDLRQAEEDLQDVRVAVDEDAGPLHLAPAMSRMQDMQDMQGQIDKLRDDVERARLGVECHNRAIAKFVNVLGEGGSTIQGRIDGLYARLKERADANRDFAAGVGARFKDQGERITRHHERAEEFDRRLGSFGARLAEVEGRTNAIRNVRDGHIPAHGGPVMDRGEKIDVR